MFSLLSKGRAAHTYESSDLVAKDVMMLVFVDSPCFLLEDQGAKLFFHFFE
jgi:hypothetical protein